MENNEAYQEITSFNELEKGGIYSSPIEPEGNEPVFDPVLSVKANEYSMRKQLLNKK